MSRPILLCPVCRAPLNRDGNRFVCCAGHAFDIARQGYVNLLLSAKGGTHGDNKLMTEARRRFLNSDGYAFLADAVAAEAAAVTPPGGSLVDAGCGEGYYTEKIVSRVAEADVRVIAVDISKDALIRLGKRHLPVLPVVASLYDLPLADACADAVVLLFSPYAEKEILRILKPNGTLLMAIPGKRHLFGLKSLLYETPYENTVADFTLNGFTLLSHRHLEKTVTLNKKEDIENLFYMTPYAYRTNESGIQRLLTAGSVTTDFSFELLIYRKIGA